MSFRAVVAIYNLLMPIAFVLSAPGYFLKMRRRGNYQRNFGQRFGFYSAEAKRELFGDPPIWIHAVSVGEVLLAHKLIRALRQARPDQRLILSCTTSTGYALATANTNLGYTAIYNPFDLPGPIRRAFRQIQPRLLVLIEAEIWPNLLHQAKTDHVPVVLANARLSPRSEARFRKFGVLTRPMFEQLDLVLAQSETDVARLVGLGIEPDRLHNTGSIKFDQEGLPDPAAQIAEFRDLLHRLRGTEEGDIILAGSTHPGEEKFIAEAFLELRKTRPKAFLVVVPRHAERAPAVVSDLKGLGLTPILKSELTEGQDFSSDESLCLIVNTTGELRAWYHLATIVLIGKSFLAEGGQNPVEPLAAGKPVIMGPDMQNFAEFVERIVVARAAVQLSQADELPEALCDLATNSDRQQKLVANVRELLSPDQGAAARSARQLLDLVET